MISKVISISEKVNTLPDVFDMLLFTWMIPHTDDFGRLAGSPVKIKALIVPMLDKTMMDIGISLQRLHDTGLIHWYEINGDRFIQVSNFEKHQSGLHKRTKSKFPEPPSPSRNFPESPGNSPRTEQKGIEEEEKGTEQNGVSADSQEKIRNWLTKYRVQCRGTYELEQVASFLGTMHVDVIEHGIKQAENKHVPYLITILQRHLNEGKTTKESIHQLRAVPDKAAKHDPELESRRVEIARNKWISEGNDPDEFVYRPASGS